MILSRFDQSDVFLLSRVSLCFWEIDKNGSWRCHREHKMMPPVSPVLVSTNAVSYFLWWDSVPHSTSECRKWPCSHTWRKLENLLPCVVRRYKEFRHDRIVASCLRFDPWMGYICQGRSHDLSHNASLIYLFSRTFLGEKS